MALTQFLDAEASREQGARVRAPIPGEGAAIAGLWRELWDAHQAWGGYPGSRDAAVYARLAARLDDDARVRAGRLVLGCHAHLVAEVGGGLCGQVEGWLERRGPGPLAPVHAGRRSPRAQPRARLLQAGWLHSGGVERLDRPRRGRPVRRRSLRRAGRAARGGARRVGCLAARGSPCRAAPRGRGSPVRAACACRRRAPDGHRRPPCRRRPGAGRRRHDRRGRPGGPCPGRREHGGPDARPSVPRSASVADRSLRARPRLPATGAARPTRRAGVPLRRGARRAPRRIDGSACAGKRPVRRGTGARCAPVVARGRTPVAGSLPTPATRLGFRA
jgi:hypothetical protein